MARPRKYVDRHGDSVVSSTGISFNRARQRSYIIPKDGQRQEFQTWNEADAALAAQQAAGIPAGELGRIMSQSHLGDSNPQPAVYKSGHPAA
jgi:hypothetical protein